MILRMIYAKVRPDQVEDARRMWKEHCAPLMIKRKGCVSEQLLADTEDSTEIVSMSTWEPQADIEAYRTSSEHAEIQKRTRELLGGARASVKSYEVVP